jgi:hypothetical protein
MAEETARKTLANCKNSEFMAAAMKARRLVYECYNAMDITAIIERFREKAKAAHEETENAAGDEKAKEAAQIKESIVALQLLPDVLFEVFEKYPTETVRLAAVCGFMTEDEAENADPAVLFEIILECATNKRVLDFFINAEKLAISVTGSIYPALKYLQLISGMKNTSESESQNSTNDTAEKLHAGDTSENA